MQTSAGAQARSALPQVNATGVMPVIFSSTLMSLPTGLAAYAPWLQPVAAALGPTGLLYLPVRAMHASTWFLLQQKAAGQWLEVAG